MNLVNLSDLAEKVISAPLLSEVGELEPESRKKLTDAGIFREPLCSEIGSGKVIVYDSGDGPRMAFRFNGSLKTVEINPPTVFIDFQSLRFFAPNTQSWKIDLGGFTDPVRFGKIPMTAFIPERGREDGLVLDLLFRFPANTYFEGQASSSKRIFLRKEEQRLRLDRTTFYCVHEAKSPRFFGLLGSDRASFSLFIDMAEQEVSHYLQNIDFEEEKESSIEEIIADFNQAGSP